MALVTFALAALLLGAVTSAAPAALLSWSAPAPIVGSGVPAAISCPDESLCVAVDGSGDVLTSTDPAAPAPSWSVVPVDAFALTGVACASASLCVAVDSHGRALASVNPSAVAWSAPVAIDGGKGEALSGVACASASLCIAAEASGGVITSAEPAAPWGARSSTPLGLPLRGVSCAGVALCVAIDGAGGAWASANPAAGGWQRRLIDPPPALSPSSVSCQAPGYCVVVDEGGNVLASADPTAGAPTWSSTPIEPGGKLVAVSCAASGLCVGLDHGGAAFASDAPTSALPSWSASTADPGNAPTAISCLAGGVCLALDLAGRSLSARVPAPAVATELPAEVTASAATLAGLVNPDDAVLSQCWFEYGTSTAYGRLVPCAGAPSATGGAQRVTAQLGGLLPNLTYHYRLLASSGAGTGAGADQEFTTAVSSQIAVVTPHPSITGTPASGQRLTCRPGTPSGAAVTLAYAWLRDSIPIAGASSSTYGVRDIDTGHHLQCQVKATDGGGSATARSAFVTVPVGGVPASAGETFVGLGRYAGGRLHVPLACSTQASGGCRVNIRLRSLGRRTVTLASASVRLSPGQHRTLSVGLTSSGRRLLAGRHRIAAELSVRGTVIGVIEASLLHQRLVVGSSAGHGSSHARTHRR